MQTFEDKLNKLIAPLLREIIFKKTITHKDLESILKITIEKIVHSLFAESITLYLVEDDKIKFRYVYFSPNLYKNNEDLKRAFEEKRKKLTRLSLPLNTGIVGKVIAENKTHIVEDVTKSKDFYAKVDEDTNFQTKSMITTPISVGDKVIGAIQVINKSIPPYKFSEADAYILEEVAQYSAKIIQKAVNPAATLTDKELAYYIARLTKQQYIELGEDFELESKILDD